MFLFNLGHRKTPVGQPHGIIYQVSQVPFEVLARRPNLETDMSKWVFLDPQLYLHSILNPEEHKNACAYLASFPWVSWQAIDCEEGMSMIEWREKLRQEFIWHKDLPTDRDKITSAIKQCFDLQVAKGVSGLIVPIPLIENLEDNFTTQLKWIDIALDLKGDYDIPLYVTIPLLDELIIHSEPENNMLIETILDQIGTRDSISGIYLLVVKSRVSNIRITEKRIVKTLFLLSYEFGNSMGLSVLVNFVDDLGLFCLAAGAQYFSSGFWKKQRQIYAQDFISPTGGRRYPSFYSARILADFRPQDDLDRLHEAKLIHLFDADYTKASADLLDAFRAGRNSEGVPTWEQAINNDTEANLHRVLRLTNAAEEMNSSKDKLGVALKWLQEAEMRANYLRDRFQEVPLSVNFQHLNVWRLAFEEFLDACK